MARLRCLVLLGLLAAAATATASPTNYMGVNAHQPKDHVLDGIKDLGMTWVRMDFNWVQMEQKQGKFTWTHFDKMVNAAHARGLKVFPTIGYGPSWATVDQDSKKGSNDCPKAGLYYKITKAGCPSCKVLGPELASVGSKHADYLEASILALKKNNLMWDIITHHIYSKFVEQDISLLACTGDTFFNDLDKHRKCMLGPVVIYEGPLSPREVLLKYKLGHLPLWLTETGLKAPITDTKKQTEQVLYYRRVMDPYLLLRDHRRQQLARQVGHGHHLGQQPQVPRLLPEEAGVGLHEEGAVQAAQVRRQRHRLQRRAGQRLRQEDRLPRRHRLLLGQRHHRDRRHADARQGGAAGARQGGAADARQGGAADARQGGASQVRHERSL